MNPMFERIVGCLAIAACLAAIDMTGVVAQDMKVTHPPFLEAAVFFLTGKEPPEAISLPDGDMQVSGRALRGGFIGPIEIFAYHVLSDDPCRVMKMETQPPYLIEFYNFNRFSGPRSARILRDGATISMNDGYCSGNGTNDDGKVHILAETPITCSSQYLWTLIGPVSRRLAALDYIRNNFCPGMPEPPLTIKPY